LIGAGRLAAALAAALLRAGYPVSAIASARIESARSLAAALGSEVAASADPRDVAAGCDVVFLAVPDGAIRRVAEGLGWRQGQVVVHCSGALGPGELAAASAAGAVAACFHPLQTFPSRTPEPARFEGIFCGVEGAEPAGSWLEQLARDLGARPFRLDGVDRAVYHAAAVVASNHVIALASAATRLWALAGLPAEPGREALAPLLVAAANNVARMDLAAALTGPVARGDIATMARHLEALERDPELRELYRRLSNELLRLPLGHDEATAGRLRELLAGPGGETAARPANR
jgi:predicted short-subunit dehydrogenase-like oxidoreductase (DUF2520 family)